MFKNLSKTIIICLRY